MNAKSTRVTIAKVTSNMSTRLAGLRFHSRPNLTDVLVLTLFNTCMLPQIKFERILTSICSDLFTQNNLAFLCFPKDF